MLKIFAWVFGVIGVIVVIIMGILAVKVFNGIFRIPAATEAKIEKSYEYKALLDGLVIEEISNNEKALPYAKPTTGDLPAGNSMVYYPDGTVSEDSGMEPDSSWKYVEILLSNTEVPSLAFAKNEVYLLKDSKMGPLIGEYSDPALGVIRHVSYVNTQYVLVVGDKADAPYAYSHLWQVDRETLEKKDLAEDIFFTFVRPPKIITPSGFDGVVIIYYTGHYSWSFEGGASRPEFSSIRIYNIDYPEGKDLAIFGFKAGTIVDARWEDESLILTSDPSRPAMLQQPRLPARIWRLHWMKL